MAGTRSRSSDAAASRPGWEVAVLGAGITGLAAAWELSSLPGVRTTVFEAEPDVGGKLRTQEVAGVAVDVGAESMLAARPEATRLAGEVGLRPSIVHPEPGASYIYSRGSMRVVPQGLITGVPTDLRALAASGVLSLPALLRVPLDHVRGRTPVGEDVSVGGYIGDRLGSEVVQRLTEPLLAGVYAGDPGELSMRMASPSLFRQIKRESSLLNAARRVRSSGASAAGARRGPAFAGIRGGISRLATKTATALQARGVHVLTNDPVERIRRVGDRWQVVTRAEQRDYDAVVLAVPAAAAAGLLRPVAPFAAVQLRTIESASVAIVSLAYPVSMVSRLEGTGFVVPPVEGYHVKGVTCVTHKWEWAARDARTSGKRGYVVVRASYGRYGDEAILDSSDDELAALAREELHRIVGLPPVSADHAVMRWPSGLPQYRVGHVSVVERAREALAEAPGLKLAGAAYDGVGVASAISSGRQQAREVHRYLEEVQEVANG